jgi:hypothetical protein
MAVIRNVYMAPIPIGDNGNTGLTSGSPVATLAKALDVARVTWGNEDAEVRVCMLTGSYAFSDYLELANIATTVCGKKFVINYENTAGVTLEMGGYALNFKDQNHATRATEYVFQTMTMNSSFTDGMLYMTAGTPTTIRTFKDCIFNNTGGRIVHYATPGTGTGGTISFLRCSGTAVKECIQYSSAAPAISLVDTTFTTTGDYDCVSSGGSVSLSISGGTISKTSVAVPVNVAAVKYALYIRGATPTLVAKVMNTTVVSTALGWSGGVKVETIGTTYLKAVAISSPYTALQITASARNVFVDGKKADGTREVCATNAPYRFKVGGTGWAAGDTIKVWVQRGQQLGSYTFEVDIEDVGRTSVANIVADFVAAWNANAPTFCKTVTASDDLNAHDTILMTSATPWLSIYASLETDGGTGTVVNRVDVTNAIALPIAPISISGCGNVLTGYKVMALDAASWEGITSAGAATPTGEGIGSANHIYDVQVVDFLNPFALRDEGVLVDDCFVSGGWPMLIEHNGTHNLVKNNTIYVYPVPSALMHSGGILWAEGGGTVGNDNEFLNNIVAAVDSLEDMGGGETSFSAYCILDYDNHGSQKQHLDNNYYYVVGNAKLAKISTVEFEGTAEGLTLLKANAWVIGGVGTRSELNDVNSRLFASLPDLSGDSVGVASLGSGNVSTNLYDGMNNALY